MAVHTVKAYPETCEVHTRQKGKTVWIASGVFQGEHIEVRTRSETSALKHWQEVAESSYRSS
jgi:hypothetical protein